jgi:long-subunit fatty acid transport protein
MDSDLVCVTGRAYQGSDLSFDKPDYTVNWPSIGNTPENAQKFAAAILAACEWVEEKKEEHENAGSIKS